jgi:hypothetical protein
VLEQALERVQVLELELEQVLVRVYRTLLLSVVSDLSL